MSESEIRDRLTAGIMKYDPLLGQPFYQVTPSTGRVHKVPCIRNTTRTPLPWPEFRDGDSDKPCAHCLPDGLPEVGR